MDSVQKPSNTPMDGARAFCRQKRQNRVMNFWGWLFWQFEYGKSIGSAAPPSPDMHLCLPLSHYLSSFCKPEIIAMEHTSRGQKPFRTVSEWRKWNETVFRIELCGVNYFPNDEKPAKLQPEMMEVVLALCIVHINRSSDAVQHRSVGVRCIRLKEHRNSHMKYTK